MNTNWTLITGANSGLGLACTKSILAENAEHRVIMACRNKQKVELIIKDFPSNFEIE